MCVWPKAMSLGFDTYGRVLLGELLLGVGMLLSVQLTAEKLFLWTSDSITPELFVLDLGGDVGGGGDQ